MFNFQFSVLSLKWQLNVTEMFKKYQILSYLKKEFLPGEGTGREAHAS